MIKVDEDEYLALIKENEKLKEELADKPPIMVKDILLAKETLAENQKLKDLIPTLEFCDGCESMTKVVETLKKGST